MGLGIKWCRLVIERRDGKMLTVAHKVVPVIKSFRVGSNPVCRRSNIKGGTKWAKKNSRKLYAS